MTIYERLRLLYGERVDIDVISEGTAPPAEFEERHYRVSTPATAEGIGALIAAFVVPEKDIQLHGQDMIAENILTYTLKVELPA